MLALLIDDSKAVRVILRKMMAELGIETVEAQNGLEGLERLNERDGIELVVVDWNMPAMNGLEFVRAVRANARFDGIMIVMATTENAIERVAEALEAGANEYIMKPFTKEIVIGKLELLGIEHN